MTLNSSFTHILSHSYEFEIIIFYICLRTISFAASYSSKYQNQQPMPELLKYKVQVLLFTKSERWHTFTIHMDSLILKSTKSLSRAAESKYLAVDTT